MIITKKHFFSFVLLAAFAAFEIISVSAHPALADEALFDSQTGMNEIGQVYGNNKTDLRVTVGKMVRIVLGFLAAIFMALTIFAGFRYMTAAGNEDQTKKAVAMLRDAIIGLIIVLAAWAITVFIMRAANWSTGGNSSPVY